MDNELAATNVYRTGGGPVSSKSWLSFTAVDRCPPLRVFHFREVKNIARRIRSIYVLINDTRFPKIHREHPSFAFHKTCERSQELINRRAFYIFTVIKFSAGPRWEKPIVSCTDTNYYSACTWYDPLFYPTTVFNGYRPCLELDSKKEENVDKACWNS